MIKFILCTMLLVSSYVCHIEAATWTTPPPEPEQQLEPYFGGSEKMQGNALSNSSDPLLSEISQIDDVPSLLIGHLSFSDMVSLTRTSKTMRNMLINDGISKVRNIENTFLQENLTGEMINPRAPYNVLLNWLNSVNIIHRMIFQNYNHSEDTTERLRRRIEGESHDQFLSRTKSVLEREALIALYNDTNGDTWMINTNWNTDTNICDWYGVYCTKGRVTGLNLSENRLTGSIPKEIGQLTNLEELDLSWNKLTGSIPKEIGLLKNLAALYLGKNQLTGSIPKEIDQLSNLRILVLGGNQLSGSIPNEIGRLSQLTHLNVNINKLTGGIPSEIGKLTKLNHLDLSENELTGSIPSEIGQVKSLEVLYLYDNKLTGPIPTQIGQLTNCEGSWLYTNEWARSIARSIARESQNLRQTDLQVPQAAQGRIAHVIHEHRHLLPLGFVVGAGVVAWMAALVAKYGL